MGIAGSVTTVADLPELFEAHRRAPADLVVADLVFTGTDPVVFTSAVHAECEYTEVVLTGAISPFTASRAMASCAKALICGFSAEPDQLTASVARSIILTYPGAVRAAASIPVQARRTVRERLTDREVQVLRAMSEGKSNVQIAAELFLSVDTVKCHAKRQFRKLGVHDRAHAVAEAFRSASSADPGAPEHVGCRTKPGARRPARCAVPLGCFLRLHGNERRRGEACAILPAGTGISEAEYRRDTGRNSADLYHAIRWKAVLTTGNDGMGDPRLAGFARRFVGLAALRWHHG